MNLLYQLAPLRKYFIVYLFPALLVIVNYFVFNFFITAFNIKDGYLSGMLFYWTFFCIIPVLLWINKRNRKILFRIKKINWWQVILILLPVAFSLRLGPFRNNIADATPFIILIGLLYSIVNAFCEEYLWRGLYINHYQANFFYAVIVPSVWFGIWYYVPLSVHPAANGNLYFILSAFGMGLCWGIVSFFTRSVFWAVISHALVDFLGINVLIFFK